MQTIYIDVSNKGIIPTIYAKQGDVGRCFEIVLTDSGSPYHPPVGSVFSAWYSGPSGDGNYTDIGDHPAFSSNGNRVVVELIAQMFENYGSGVLSIILNETSGKQIASWNIPYFCESIPGWGSEEAEAYFSAFSKAVAELPYPDQSLSISGKAADAGAVGEALKDLVPKTRTVNGKKLTDNIVLSASDVGAAPAGFGLGNVVDIDASDLDTTYANGWYRLSSQGITLGGFTATDWFLHVTRYSTKYIVQRLYPMTSYRIELIRWCTNGTWYEEWVNPPMVPNEEYRTTERWGGKAVYAKYVTYKSDSDIAGEMTVSIPHGISDFGGIVRINAYNGDYLFPSIEGNTNYTTIYRVTSQEIILLNKGVQWSSARTSRFDVRYVKNND